jgi:diguanylate cyclase (GGDEF)-like protein
MSKSAITLQPVQAPRKQGFAHGRKLRESPTVWVSISMKPPLSQHRTECSLKLWFRYVEVSSMQGRAVKDGNLTMVASRRQLGVWVAVLLVLGSFATSVGSYVVSRRSIRSSIVTNQLPLTSDSVYSEIQRDLLRPISVSDQMAHDTFLRDWYQAGETSEAPIRRYLSEIQQRFHATTSFFVSERTRNYYHPDGIVQKVSESDAGDAWYFRVRTMSIPYEINVDTDDANNQTSTVFINFRMVDDHGNFLGVTGVGLTLQSINEVVANYELKFNRRIYFVDQKGNPVLDSASLGGRSSTNLRRRAGIAAIADKILSGSAEPKQLAYKLNRSTVHVNTRRIAELNWFLIVEQNEDNAVRPVQTVLFWNLLVGALVTGVVISGLTITVNRYQRKLEHQANTDSLTNIANRRHGEELLSQSVQTAHRVGHDTTELSALLIDIDHFKTINDLYGHPTGDEVIKEVVSKIDRAIRTDDHLIRWGGEEFLVLLPNCDTSHATDIANAIVDLVATQHHRGQSKSETTLPPATVSIGVASLLPDEARHPFLARIDTALYQAKTSGRNQTKTCALHEDIRSNKSAMAQPTGLHLVQPHRSD